MDPGVRQERTRPLILRYHGRECLFDWMKQQVEEAIYHNRDVSPYPEFLKQQIKQGKVSMITWGQANKWYTFLFLHHLLLLLSLSSSWELEGNTRRPTWRAMSLANLALLFSTTARWQ